MSRFLEQFRLAGGDVEGVMERFMDDEELLRDCLAQFVTEDDFERLKEAVLGQDYQKAFEYAHALKGVVGNLGLTTIYAPLTILVEALRGKVYTNVEEDLATVLEQKEAFMEKYREMV